MKASVCVNENIVNEKSYKKCHIGSDIIIFVDK